MPSAPRLRSWSGACGVGRAWSARSFAAGWCERTRTTTTPTRRGSKNEQGRPPSRLGHTRIRSRLEGRADLQTRKPYRNKDYFVACRRGRRAAAGLFLETPEPVRQFTAVTRWSLAAEILVTHRVRYIVLDDDFDAVTDNMVHWHAFRDFGSRLPTFAKDWAPVKAQPCMDVLRCHSDRVGEVMDATTRSGLIEERDETLRHSACRPLSGAAWFPIRARSRLSPEKYRFQASKAPSRSPCPRAARQAAN